MPALQLGGRRAAGLWASNLGPGPPVCVFCANVSGRLRRDPWCGLQGGRS